MPGTPWDLRSLEGCWRRAQSAFLSSPFFIRSCNVSRSGNGRKKARHKVKWPRKEALLHETVGEWSPSFQHDLCLRRGTGLQTPQGESPGKFSGAGKSRFNLLS